MRPAREFALEWMYKAGTGVDDGTQEDDAEEIAETTAVFDKVQRDAVADAVPSEEHERVVAEAAAMREFIGGLIVHDQWRGQRAKLEAAISGDAGRSLLIELRARRVVMQRMSNSASWELPDVMQAAVAETARTILESVHLGRLHLTVLLAVAAEVVLAITG